MRISYILLSLSRSAEISFVLFSVDNGNAWYFWREQCKNLSLFNSNVLYHEEFSIMFSAGFSRFSIVLGVESIVVVFVMLFRAYTSFSQNGDRPKFSFVLMLITSLTSLTHLFIFVSNIAAMTSVDKSFNPAQIAWNKRNKTHNTIPRQWSLFCVVLLYQEGFAIVPAIEFNQFCIVSDSVQATFKMAANRILFCPHNN